METPGVVQPSTSWIMLSAHPRLGCGEGNPCPQEEVDPDPDYALPLLGAQYVAEAEEKLQRARLLVDSVRKEKVDLSNQLEEERRYALPPCPPPGSPPWE